MKLKEYLEQNHVSYQKFAREVGRTRQCIYDLTSSRRYPSTETVNRIYNVTGGLVTEKDFIDQHKEPVSMPSSKNFWDEL